jgi:hypothetical protein
MDPQFPLYIPSKGRWELRQTARALDSMNLDYLIVVEEQEFPNYAAVIPREKILVLDKQYQREYDTFDDLGDSKSKGPGAARNFIWDHSIAQGFDWHWVMDDNIRVFYRLNRNTKIRLRCGAGFRAMEDFVLRYENVAMAGPNYEMFVPRKYKAPPFITNTRIYSCNLIRNAVPFRWRGRYNEDTDLSLRMLKAGWCTIQFNAFLQDKAPTQTLKGGNTDEFYAKEGTLAKSKMQVAMHPDVSKLVKRFGRWHHHVNYKVFAKQKLIRRPDLDIPAEVDEYGMVFAKVDPKKYRRKGGKK